MASALVLVSLHVPRCSLSEGAFRIARMVLTRLVRISEMNASGLAISLGVVVRTFRANVVSTPVRLLSTGN